MFKEYNPMQYLAIDVASRYGHDKLTFEERIEWTKSNIDILETLTDADEPFQYMRSVKAFRDAQAGIPTGHTIPMDAVCSGMQIMSALVSCESGMAMTGLIHPDKRTDAYTLVTQAMNKKVHIKVARKDAKQAIMTFLYGSKATPRAVFGDLYDTFIETMEEEATGAMMLMQAMLGAWNPNTNAHSWILPDNHYAHVPVTETIESRIHVSELAYTPVVTHTVVGAQEYGISLPANITHSLDSYILRTLVRRLNYSPRALQEALRVLKTNMTCDTPVSVAEQMYLDTNIVDLTMVIDVPRHVIIGYPQAMKDKLIRMIEMSLSHKPFELVVIHDSFACSPVNCNQLRRTYADIMGDLVDSTLIDHILSQLLNDDVEVEKLGDRKELAAIVRQSNYSIN